MRIPLLVKLGIPLFTIISVLLMLFISTWILTTWQEQDALIINLAGRQRMLTQKAMKEYLTIHTADNDENRKKLQSTTELFELSFHAMQHGGRTFIDLKQELPVQVASVSDETAQEAFARIDPLWLRFKDLVAKTDDFNKEDLLHMSVTNQQLLQELDNLVRIHQRAAETNVHTIRIVQLLLSGAGVLASILSVIYALLRVIRPLQTVTSNLHALSSGQGDLTGRLQQPSNDEIGDLTQSYNHVAETLRSRLLIIFGAIREAMFSVGGINRTIQTFSSNFRQMEKDIESGEDGIIRIDKSIVELNHSLKELSITSQDLTDAVTHVDRLSHSIQARTEEGKQQIQNVSTVLSSMVQTVDQSAAKSKGLADKAAVIKDVVATIDAVSEKTNLLALNAAIEAARAGESGRGFSVVASEIGKLSESSKRAVEEISRSMEDIIREIHQTAESATDLSHKMQSLVAVNSTAAEKLTDIFENIRSLESNVQSVSATSEETQATVTVIARASDSIAANAKDLTGRLELLNRHAHKMDAEVGGIHSAMDRVSETAATAVNSLNEISVFNREDFRREVEAASESHRNWINKLDGTLSGAPRDLELNPERCYFGIFYMASPPPRGCENMWLRIGELHRAIHASAELTFTDLDRGNRKDAASQVGEARKKSEELLQLLSDCAAARD